MARTMHDDPDVKKADGRAGGQQKRLSGARAAQLAQAQLQELTGQVSEAVSGLSRTPEGWAVTVEVVELERIPRSTDILASYRVELDDVGELMGYERVGRYYRNVAGGE